MPDMSTIPTEELLRMRQASEPNIGIQNIPIETLLDMQKSQIQEPGLDTHFISPTIPLRPGQPIPLGRQSIESLISTLGTTMPTREAPKQIPEPLPTTELGLEFTVARTARADEVRRQRHLQIVQELGLRGFTLRDIEERLSPTVVEQFKQDIGRTTGGITGGIAGAKAGAMIGTAIMPGGGTLIGGLAGAAIGAGLAGFVGEDIQNTMEMVQIARKSQRGERLTFNEEQLISRTENEIAAERRNAGFGEAFYELVGRVGIGALAKVFRRPFARAVLPEVAEFADEFAKVGGRFSPAQLVEGSAAQNKLTAFFADFIDTLESIGEKGFGGRGIFKRFRALKQTIPYEKLIKEIADSVTRTAIRMTPEQKAILLLDILKNRKTAYKGVRNSLYRWARKANKGNEILVSIEPLEKFLKNERRRVTGKLGGTELGESLLSKLDNIVNQIKTRGRVRAPKTGRFASGKQMTILEVEDMLIGLNSEITKLGRAGDTPGKRIATVTKSIMTKQARRAEQGLEPEVFRRLRVAKKFVREGQPIFEEQFIKTLLDAKKGLRNNPEILNKILFPRGKPSQIARAKELIIGTGKFAPGINKRKWNNLGLGWLEDAIQGSIDASTGIFSPQRFQTRLNQMGKRSLDIMFEPTVSKRIHSIPKIGRILIGETGGGGNLAIRIAQIGAVGGIATGEPTVQLVSGVILMTPSALALLFTSDIGIKALTTGLKAKAGSREAAVMVARMAGIVSRLRKQKGIIQERQIRKRKRELTTRQEFRAFGGTGF